ncbi:MAG: DUF1559 domain-containing protein [Zavarzinella sp.]
MLRTVNSSHSSRGGYTFVKVLLIIAIFVMLIGLLLPSVRRVREPAERSKCMNNLKQLMFAQHFYSDRPDGMNNGEAGAIPSSFPTGCMRPGVVPEDRLSWLVALLPYLEQDHLHKQFDFNKGWHGNLRPGSTVLTTLLCPTAKAKAPNDRVTHYVAMAGIGNDAALQPAGTPGNGFMGYDRLTNYTLMKDGSSNTIALMETNFNPGPWARGGNSTVRGFDPATVIMAAEHQSFGIHTGVIQVAMVDASTRAIKTSIDPKVLAAAITIAGNESENLD